MSANLRLYNMPYLTEEAISFLKSVIKKSDRILEFGSGGSTIWFAKNGGHVMSFEHDNNWCQAIKNRLKKLDLNNVDLRFAPNYIREGYLKGDEMFDFILVDSKIRIDDEYINSRTLCTKTAYLFLKPGGWLFLDNTGKEACKESEEFMGKLGWMEKSIKGQWNAKAWKRPMSVSSRGQMREICSNFGIVLKDVEKKLKGLGNDGMLIERISNKLVPVPQDYFSELGLHLNRFYFAMASLVLNDVRNVLEIGTGSAESAICFSKLFPEATIYTVDIPSNDPDKGMSWGHRSESWKRELYKANLSRGENIVLIEQNSFFLPSMDLPDKFDIILVDGAHHYPPVAADHMFAYGHIAKGGFMFMHDYFTPESKSRHHQKNRVGLFVDWMAKRVPEKVFLLPQITPPILPDKKMPLLVKGRKE